VPARRYFDHNATTPLDPRVRSAMEAAADAWGNPSSVHAEGRRARELVERARAEVAALVGGSDSGVVFTSGGTEADLTGVLGAARAARAAGRPARVVSTALEHPAVRGALAALAGEGFEVVLARVDAAGRVDVDDVARALGGGAAVCAVALANHELGNVAPLGAIAAAARAAGAVMFVDAVQAAGKLAIDAAALGADLIAVSAHKIGGPKGAGALWIRPGVLFAPPTPAGAGHQERGLRAGTENVAGVVGLGAAAAIARSEGLAGAARVAALRDRLEAAAVALGARVHGDVSPGGRVGNTANLAWEGVPGDVLVAALDLEGFAVSTGAACTSGSVEPSPVLLALGLARARAAEAVRVSLGRTTSDDDVDALVETLARVVPRVRAAMASRGAW
jgi:cysteine desulfurase